ncbi:hypothetical protein J5A57_09420 [Prevotella melaninogenica]|nr:hypothetical protein J5A57_09420 [Prevotella melaninogenica]
MSGKSPHLRVVFSAKTLCKPAPLPLFCYKKDELLRALPEKSAYSDLWTHKKNVAMDKQKVNTTSSMNRKGYSSSSHYRINPVAEKSEQVLAIKFVQWDVLPLESLCNSKVYLLRVKLNRGECMSREEKNWLCEAVNSNTYFRTAVPLQGYRFDFFDVLKKYLVNQYGQWTEYYAPDRTSLRAYLYGRINQIVELKIGGRSESQIPKY